MNKYNELDVRKSKLLDIPIGLIALYDLLSEKKKGAGVLGKSMRDPLEIVKLFKESSASLIFAAQVTNNTVPEMHDSIMESVLQGIFQELYTLTPGQVKLVASAYLRLNRTLDNILSYYGLLSKKK